MLVHLAVQIPSADIRRETTGVLASAATARPQLVHAVLRDALAASLTKPVPAPTKLATGEEQDKPAVDKRGRYAAVVVACAGVGDTLDKAAKEALVVEWLVLAHHPAICTFSLLFCCVFCVRDGMGRWAVTSAVDRTVSKGRYGPVRGVERAHGPRDETRARGVHDGSQGAPCLPLCA